MSNAKEIAEMIIEQSPDFWVKEITDLASAYLELEKQLAQEITKLKAENEYLLRQYGDEVSGLCDDKRFKKIIELESEITKLKKSREGLRKAVEWYSDGIYPNDVSQVENGNFISGKIAREALKADDELMGGGE